MLTLTALLLLAMSPHTARSRELGSTVTVEGYVTVQSGVYNDILGDNGFVLGNAATGLYVTTDKGGYHSLGTALEVRGVLADHHGLLVLRAREIRLAKGRSLVRPEPIKLTELNESTEGRIVQLTGEIASAPVRDTGGSRFTLRDGSAEAAVYLPNFIKLESLTAGKQLKVSGWCAQRGRSYELVVRKDNDLKLAR